MSFVSGVDGIWMKISDEEAILFIEYTIEEEILNSARERELHKSIDEYRGYQCGLKKALDILRSTGRGRHGYDD